MDMDDKENPTAELTSKGPETSSRPSSKSDKLLGSEGATKKSDIGKGDEKKSTFEVCWAIEVFCDSFTAQCVSHAVKNLSSGEPSTHSTHIRQ